MFRRLFFKWKENQKVRKSGGYLRNLVLLGLVMIAFGSLGFFAFATPPTSPYTPGETLAPSCSPGDTNCTVTAPATSGANSNITSLSGLSTALSIAQGGTGASDASTARTNLGLAIGTNVQAWDADLVDLADGTLSKTKVEDSTNWDTAYGWGDWSGNVDISDDTNLAGGTNLTLTGDTLSVDDVFLINNGDDTTTGSLTFKDGVFTPEATATATEGRVYYDSDDDNLYVYDGSTWLDLTNSGGSGDLLSTNNLSDLADASTARTNLGLAIGSDVQAYDAQLDDLAALALTDGNIIVGDGTNWVAESGATARTSLGLGSVEDTALSTWAGTTNITTLGTISTGTWNATDIPLSAGGTGASLTDPNDDRIFFWDDSAGISTWLDIGSGLTLSGTTITANAATTDLDDAYNNFSTSAAIINIDDNGNSANNGIEFLIADGSLGVGSSAFVIDNNDITGNPNSLVVENAGTAYGLFIDQDGNGVSLNIDSEATTANVSTLDGSALTTGYILNLVGGDFTNDSGMALNIDVTESTETADIFNIQTNYSSSNNNVFRIEADGEAFSDVGFTAGAFSTNFRDGSITSTGSFTYSSATSFSWEDDSSNTLMVMTDGGTTGVLDITGNLVVDSEVTTGTSLTASSDSLTTGSVLALSSSSASATTSDLATFSISPTYTSSTTYSGQMLDISRNLTINGLGETLTASGAIVNISNDGTETSGTLADSSSMMILDQNYAGATGAVLNIDSEATAAIALAINADSMTTSTGIDISIDALTTGTGIFLERANDASSDFTNTGQGLMYVNQADESSTGTVLHIKSASNAGILGHFEHTGLSSGDPVLKVISDRPTTTAANQGINGFLAEFKNIAYSPGSDTRQGIVIQACNYTNPASSCNLIEFRDGNGTVIGAVEGDGAGGVSTASAGSDYAELFPGNYSDFEAGDIIAVDYSGSVVLASEANDIIGAYSIAPNTLGNWVNKWKEIGTYVPVALLGQVPIKVNMEGGAIEVGDYITLSSVSGVGKKVTGVGKTIGQALESHSSGNGVIQVYVNPSWNAMNMLTSDGSAMNVNSDVVISAQGLATLSNPGFDSNDFVLRGSVWGDTEESVDMIMLTDVTDSSDYKLSFKNNNEDEVVFIGNSGDLAIAGRLYPSDRGVLQTEKYIYYDGSDGPGGDFMRTNASGWATGSYDFAEMFPSLQVLSAGEVVVFSSDKEHVQRSTGEIYDQKIAGVISTRPGFLAGDNNEGDVPVALAGRVPTYVSGENGAINSGDPITTSSKPGYAMKATESGPIIGYAMEAFSGDTGSIVVFIRPSYYDGGGISNAPASYNVASGISDNVSEFNTAPGSDIYVGNTLNILALSSLTGNWMIEEDGDFITRGRITQIVKSHQGYDIETFAVTATESKIELSGTIQMQEGRAHVYFDDFDQEFKNIISTTADYRVLVTASGPSGLLYISQKENDGFIIRENNGNTNTKVDWLVIAYHKDYEPNQEIIEDIIMPEAVNKSEVIEDVGEIDVVDLDEEQHEDEDEDENEYEYEDEYEDVSGSAESIDNESGNIQEISEDEVGVDDEELLLSTEDIVTDELKEGVEELDVE